jgi:hypothetical protein
LLEFICDLLFEFEFLFVDSFELKLLLFFEDDFEFESCGFFDLLEIVEEEKSDFVFEEEVFELLDLFLLSL